MRRGIKILGVVLGLLVIGVVVWFATMPYPITRWLEACCDVQTWNLWPLAQSDEAMAKHLVGQRLGFREIITGVTMVSPDEIRISVLSRYRDPLAAAGRYYVVKKVDGAWKIAERGRWIS